MELPDLSGLDNDRLRAKLDELSRQNDLLHKEAETFEAYLKRHARPEELEELAAEANAFASSSSSASSASSSSAAGGGGGLKGKKGAKATRKGPTALTPEQQQEVAASELEATKAETANAVKQGNAVIETLEAMARQCDVRHQDVKREAYEFKRDVILAGMGRRDGEGAGGERKEADGPDTLTGKVSAERVIKYYEDSLRAKDALVDKLRLKNAALKAQQAKLAEQLKGKEDASDVLHYIDFHQLQIENAQHLGKIEEKNAELLRLKLTTGNTVAMLNQLKGKLGELTREASRLRHDIRARTALLAKLRVDNDEISALVAAQMEAAAKLTAAARGAEDMPTTLDYVDLSRTQASIQHEIDSWQRKVEIATLTAKGAKAKAKAAGISAAQLTATAEAARRAGGVGSIASSLLSHGGGGMGVGGGEGSLFDDGGGLGRTINTSFFGSTHGGVSAAGTPAIGNRAGFSGATMTGAANRTPAVGAAGQTPASHAPSSAAAGSGGVRSAGLGGATGMFPPPSSAGAASGTARTTAAFGAVPGSAEAAMPGYGVPVGFGSTTKVEGITATRPLGSVAGAVKDRPAFRTKPAPLPKGVGGFRGAYTQHLTGSGAGTLQLGAPARSGAVVVPQR